MVKAADIGRWTIGRRRRGTEDGEVPFEEVGVGNWLGVKGGIQC